MLKDPNQFVRVGIADDHEVFRMGVKHLLSKTPNIDLILEAANGKELIAKMRDTAVNVILMDIGMPIMNGIEATKIIRIQFPAIHVIALTTHSQPKYVQSMVDAGASGFILKSSSIDEYLLAIQMVSKGATYFSQDIMNHYFRPKDSSDKSLHNDILLTQRETEVLRLVCNGLDNQSIADTLCISVRTVEKHKSNLLLKFGVENTIQLVVFAYQNNLTELELKVRN